MRDNRMSRRVETRSQNACPRPSGHFIAAIADRERNVPPGQPLCGCGITVAPTHCALVSSRAENIITPMIQKFWSDFLGSRGAERACFCQSAAGDDRLAITGSEPWSDCPCWNSTFKTPKRNTPEFDIYQAILSDRADRACRVIIDLLQSKYGMESWAEPVLQELRHMMIKKFPC